MQTSGAGIMSISVTRPATHRAAQHSPTGSFGWDTSFGGNDPFSCKFFDEACGYGIRHGYTIPIHHWHGRFTALTFATDDQYATFLHTTKPCARAAGHRLSVPPARPYEASTPPYGRSSDRPRAAMPGARKAGQTLPGHRPYTRHLASHRQRLHRQRKGQIRSQNSERGGGLVRAILDRHPSGRPTARLIAPLRRLKASRAPPFRCRIYPSTEQTG